MFLRVRSPVTPHQFSLRFVTTWTTNGKLTEDKRKIYFNAGQQENVKKLILPAVKQENFVFLHGPRSSGKSTLFSVASSILSEDFTFVFADFQRVTLHKGKNVFWNSFGRELVINNYSIPPINNARDFIDTFTKRNWEKMAKVSPGKPVILIIDEFGELYSQK